jgi:hypothetical protein
MMYTALDAYAYNKTEIAGSRCNIDEMARVNGTHSERGSLSWVVDGCDEGKSDLPRLTR